MKINRSEIERLYQSMIKSGDKKEPSGSVDAEKDKVAITDAAKSRSGMGGIVKSVVTEATEPTAPEKLLRLKNQIARGDYSVSAKSIAEAMCGCGGEDDDE